MAPKIFKSYQSTVTPFAPRDFPKPVRLLLDPTTGAPTGIQTDKANGPDGIWTPVDLTAAQITSPTAAMLADLNATYRLNVPPYTRYYSTGTVLQAIGGGSGNLTARQWFNNSVDYDGAIAHWTLDEVAGSTTLVDRIGGFNLTDLAGQTLGVGDIFSRMASLSGSSSKLAQASHSNGLELEYDTDITIEAVVTPQITKSGATTTYAVVAMRNPSAPNVGYEFYVQWNNTLGTTIFGLDITNPTTSRNIYSNTVDILNDTEYHMLVNQVTPPPSGGTSNARVILDGNTLTPTAAASWGSPANPSIKSPTTIGMIGARGNASFIESFKGYINEVMIYRSSIHQDSALMRKSLSLDRVPVNTLRKGGGDPNYFILTTDVDGDAGNIGAIQYAIAMHVSGAATLLAVCCSTQSPWGPAFIDSVMKRNAQIYPGLGLENIPIGGYKGSAGPASSSDSWVQSTAQTGFPALNSGLKANYPDALTVVRQALINIPDPYKCRWYESGIATLLDGVAVATADALSLLSGADLIRQKVEFAQWNSATNFILGSTAWSASAPANVTQEPVSAAAIWTDWPVEVPLLVFDAHIGNGLLTGSGGYGDMVNSIETQPQVHNSTVATGSPSWYGWLLSPGGGPTFTRPSWEQIGIRCLIYGEFSYVRPVGIGGKITFTAGTTMNFVLTSNSNHHVYLRLPTAGLSTAMVAEINATLANIY